MIKKILVPVDGSQNALHALDFAMDLARKLEAEIIVANVDIPYDLSRLKPVLKDADGKEIAPKKLTPLEEAKRFVEKAAFDQVSYRRLVDIDPAERIVAEAEKSDVDLIIMGNRGMGVLAGFFLGSVSTKVSQTAHCPVTIVK
jgi:nucleotide-binding universal stress UspA family protein